MVDGMIDMRRRASATESAVRRIPTDCTFLFGLIGVEDIMALDRGSWENYCIYQSDG